MKKTKQLTTLRKAQNSLQQRSKRIRLLFRSAQTGSTTSRSDVCGYFDEHIEEILAGESMLDAILAEIQTCVHLSKSISDATWEEFHLFADQYLDRVEQSAELLGSYGDSLKIKVLLI